MGSINGSKLLYVLIYFLGPERVVIDYSLTKSGVNDYYWVNVFSILEMF